MKKIFIIACSISLLLNLLVSSKIAEGDTRCTVPSCCDQQYTACLEECKGLTGEARIVCRHECQLEYNTCMDTDRINLLPAHFG
jgi:hypothetical protein